MASDRARDQIRSYVIDPRTGRLDDVTDADGDNTPDETGTDGEVRVNINFKFLDAGILTG